MPVQCRKCYECYAAKRRHYIGRIMAETQTCDEIMFLTLTYDGGYDNDEAYILTYRHVQLMFKRLRKEGYRFKYVCVGEHGEQKQRAHWHLLLMFEGEAPPIEYNKEKYHWPYWFNKEMNLPRGYVYAEKPRSRQATATYIMGYLDKDQKHKTMLKVSKRPALGEKYLLQYAEEHADKGVQLFVESDRFTIPGNLNKHGKPFYYPVGRDTVIYQKMLDTYLSRWAQVRPDQRLPIGDFDKNPEGDVVEYMSDVAQDTNDQPPHVVEYLANIYDIQPVYAPALKRQTTYTMDNYFSIVVDGFKAELRHTNLEGTVIWQEPLKESPKPDHTLTQALETEAIERVKVEARKKRFVMMLQSDAHQMRQDVENQNRIRFLRNQTGNRSDLSHRGNLRYVEKTPNSKKHEQFVTELNDLRAKLDHQITGAREEAPDRMSRGATGYVEYVKTSRGTYAARRKGSPF